MTTPNTAAKPDLNKATKEQISKVPMLTDRRADMIIAARDQQFGGSFDSFDQLDEIPGIGKTMMQMIKNNFTLGGKESPDLDKAKGAAQKAS